MNEPSVNDSASRFSLKKLFVIPFVFAVALLLWRVSPLHGVVGLVAASTLSAAILLAQRMDHRPLAVKFVFTLLFSIFAGFVAEATLLPKSPPKGFLILFFLAIVVGGVFGWSLARLITQRGRDSSNDPRPGR